MSKISNVWVFSNSVDRYADLLAGAHQLGERVNAVIWNEEDAAQVAQADAIYLLEGKTDQQRIENYAETLATLVQSKQKHWLYWQQLVGEKHWRQNSACCCIAGW